MADVWEYADYYHRNQQYSITALTNSSGGILERYAYTAYGVPTIANSSGTVLSSSAQNNRYTYTGREWDNDVKLYHYRARMYDSSLGRFCSRDPIDYVDGPNNFAFALLNPLKFSDFSGFLSTVVQEGPEITSAENTGCGSCCCCPKKIEVEFGETKRPGGTSVKGTPYATTIKYTITMEYKDPPGRGWGEWAFGGYSIHCRLAFAEFPQVPPGTITAYEENNVWHDSVSEHDGGITEEDYFDAWKSFDPGKPPCTGTASIPLTDKPQGQFKEGDKMRFWQYIAVMGGDDCNCKPPKIDILTALDWTPPRDPKGYVSPSPVNGFTPQRPTPVPDNLLPLPVPN